MNMLTVKQVRQVFGVSNLDERFCVVLALLLHKYAKVFKIDTVIKRVRFLAQAVHETGIRSDGTIRLRENLNYKATVLPKLSRFFRSNPDLAEKYGRTSTHSANQEMIANYWYGGRLGNGDADTGDGFRFRGFGIFQTTGRYNFNKDIDQVHELVMDRIACEDYEVYEDYKAFILIGMGHWYRTRMWQCSNTNCVTNIINKGLPSSYKQDRLNTAIRIQKLLS